MAPNYSARARRPNCLFYEVAEVKLPFTLDQGAAAKAAFGVIILQADETLESEFAGLFDQPGLALYHTRIPSGAEVTQESLARMEREMPHAAALLPSARDLDVVAYACTSGATIIGPEKVAGAIHTVHPKAKTTDPLSAVIAACRHFGIRNLGVVSPYVAEVCTAMNDLLEQNGLTIAAFGSFEQSEEAVVARITPQSAHDAICAIGRNDAVDAVFASCTNLRTFEIIDSAEAAIGKPVITSNQALAWHMLTLADVATENLGPGMLFRGRP
jgi:maleate isomerase